MSYIGAVSANELGVLSAQMTAALNSLVSTARDQTAKILDDNFIGLFGRKFAQDHANNIVNSCISVRDTLAKSDSTGKPFFLRQAQSAQLSLRRAQELTTRELDDFRRDVEGQTFTGAVTTLLNAAERAISSAFEFALTVIFKIVEAVAKGLAAGAGAALGAAPFGALLLALGAGAVLYVKLRRSRRGVLV